jgi:hypothetical protein
MKIVFDGAFGQSDYVEVNSNQKKYAFSAFYLLLQKGENQKTYNLMKRCFLRLRLKKKRSSAPYLARFFSSSQTIH